MSETRNDGMTFLCTLTAANNYTVTLDLQPAIENAYYGRMISDIVTVIKTNIFSTCYVLTENNSIEQPIDEFLTRKDIIYKTASNSIGRFQTVSLAESSTKETVSILFEFFYECPQNLKFINE
jgi:hypothetical protein